MPTINDEGLEGKLYACTKWAHNAGGLITAAGVSTSEGAGGQHGVLLAASELTGVTMDTGDELYDWLDLKGELFGVDLSKDLLVQPVIISSGGAADTGAQFDVSIKGVAEAEAISDAKVSADGSASWTTLGITGASKVQALSVQSLRVPDELSSDEIAMIASTLTSRGTASADEIALLCVRIFGTMQICHSSGSKQYT